jgi:hypothetical protein
LVFSGAAVQRASGRGGGAANETAGGAAAVIAWLKNNGAQVAHFCLTKRACALRTAIAVLNSDSRTLIQQLAPPPAVERCAWRVPPRRSRCIRHGRHPCWGADCECPPAFDHPLPHPQNERRPAGG